MGDTMLGDPYIDNRTTTEKRLESKLGLLTVCQTFHHFHVLLTIQFSCLHLDLWVETCWIRASIRWAAFPPVAEEETWVYDGLWPLGHETFQFSCGWGGDLPVFYRYTTILNSGILKVIQFKHGTLGSLGPQHWGFCAAVTSQQEWGPDVDTTTADWSTTNSWNVQPRSLHGDVVAMTPWSGAGCRMLPLKHGGWLDDPLGDD